MDARGGFCFASEVRAPCRFLQNHREKEQQSLQGEVPTRPKRDLSPLCAAQGLGRVSELDPTLVYLARCYMLDRIGLHWRMDLLRTLAQSFHHHCGLSHKHTAGSSLSIPCFFHTLERAEPATGP